MGMTVIHMIKIQKTFAFFIKKLKSASKLFNLAVIYSDRSAHSLFRVADQSKSSESIIGNIYKFIDESTAGMDNNLSYMEQRLVVY